MEEYTDEMRDSDFDFFVENYHALYSMYGHSYIAIKNKQVIYVGYVGYKETISDLIKKYKLGTYIIQECTGDKSAYMAYRY